MSSETQAVLLNGIPLLALAALYLVAAAALVPAFVRARARLRDLELALVLVYPATGLAAGVLGVAVLDRREPLAGSVWLGIGAIVLAAVPPLAFLARWRERERFFAGARRAHEAERLTTALERERDVVNAFTTSLARTGTPDEIGTMLVAHVADLLGVPFAAIAVVEGRWIHGLTARLDGEAVDWWRGVRLDRETESSAIVSAAFESASLTIYDVEASTVVHRGLAQRVGAKSAAFVPCVSGEDVVAVLVVATTTEPHAFSREEVALLEELAAETAMALKHTRSASALAEALEREQLVARISHKVRSESDLDSVLTVAVEETAGAVEGVSRSFIRLGEPGTHMPVRAEWHAAGLEPIGTVAGRLPVSNLAAKRRRTVAIGDVEAAPELDDSSLGGRDTLLNLGTQAVLATPIIVLDRLIGVFGLHRRERCVWAAQEIALAEAVAHEVGLAINTATLLGENRLRIRRQEALLGAAQALAGDLRFEAVIQRLVDEVVTLVGADAADCWVLERRTDFLSCRAVHGAAPSEAGGRMRVEGPVAEAIAGGRPVLKRGDAGAPGYAAGMLAPIALLGKGRGILRVWATDEQRFGEDDLEMLEAFATLASLALRNAEAFEEGSRQARIQRGFYRIASVLAEPLSLTSTLDALAQAAREALGAAFVAVLMSRGGELELAGSEALPPELERALGRGLGPGDTVLRTAAADARVLAASDLATDSRFDEEWRELVAQAGSRSLLAIPVPASRNPETPWLVLVFFGEQRTFTDDDLELARHVAGAARGALDRSSAFEEERTARSLAQELARTGARLATELDPEAVLDAVVEQALELVAVDACAIRLVEDEELVVTAATGPETSHVLGVRSAATGWVSGDVVQSNAPLSIEDAAGDERLLSSDPLLRLGYRAYLGVPFAAAEGAVRGVLAVYSRRLRTWREGEIEALLALAGNASAALSNAELYQQVALEKDRSDAILANVADGIVAVDREGSVVLWNAAAERITGVPMEDAVRSSPADVLGRDLGAEGDADVRNRQVPILRGGEEVWLSVSEAVMRDPAGAVAGRIYAFRDVSTERVVEEMKSEFVSTVSEQLRRPLTSIYGFAETLLREDVLFEENERRTFLGYIASESERLTAIVDQLLNVARLDTGDLHVQLAPTDVRTLVEEVVASVDGATLNGHRFVVDLPAEPIAAAADREKLRLVLANLVDNAVKYSPTGGRVTVAARRLGDAVEVSVADEGIGIPAAAQERIFRKFSRGDFGGARSSGGGTGLGLFIVEGLVNAMNGRISVTSAEGEGSNFTVLLPAAEPGMVATPTEQDAERV